MNYSKSEFLEPKEEQSVIGLKDCEIKGNLVGQGNADKVTCSNETDREDELFVRLELPLVITGWIIFLITFGYFMYVAV
jgi:hypothetical protein